MQKQNFFKNMVAELKKVIWPTKKQTINNTITVLIVIAIFSVVVISLDLILNGANGLLWNWIIGK